MRIVKDILLVISVIVIIYLLFFRKDPMVPNSDLSELHYDSIRMYQDSLVVVQDRVRDKEDSIRGLKLASKRSEDRYQKSIAQARTREVRDRAEIQPMIDTLPKIKAYIAFRDSLDSLYLARMDTLTEEKRIQDMVYKDLIKDKDAETAIGKSILRNAYVIIDEKDLEISGLKRKKFWRTVRDILIGAGAFFTIEKIAELADGK